MVAKTLRMLKVWTKLVFFVDWLTDLLPTGSKEREVLGVGSIPDAILPSCQDMKTIA